MYVQVCGIPLVCVAVSSTSSDTAADSGDDVADDGWSNKATSTTTTTRRSMAEDSISLPTTRRNCCYQSTAATVLIGVMVPPLPQMGGKRRTSRSVHVVPVTPASEEVHPGGAWPQTDTAD